MRPYKLHLPESLARAFVCVTQDRERHSGDKKDGIRYSRGDGSGAEATATKVATAMMIATAITASQETAKMETRETTKTAVFAVLLECSHFVVSMWSDRLFFVPFFRVSKQAKSKVSVHLDYTLS